MSFIFLFYQTSFSGKNEFLALCIDVVWAPQMETCGTLMAINAPLPIRHCSTYISIALKQAKNNFEKKIHRDFAIPSSTRREKCCQILEIIFCLFQFSRNVRCVVCLQELKWSKLYYVVRQSKFPLLNVKNKSILLGICFHASTH